jgi:prophage DNA circulation protein
MSNIEKFNPAEFRGISFLVPDESEESGQKTVTHEYPNSNVRFVEPLGTYAPVFSFPGIVSGDDFFERRGDLKEALDTPGLGILIHPVYGVVFVQPLKYNISSSQKRVGEFIFNMEFALSDSDISPTPLPQVPSVASFRALLTQNALNDALNAFRDINIGGELLSAANAALSVLDVVQSGVNAVFQPATSLFAAANSAISNFRNKVFRIMQTGAGFKQAVTDLYSTIRALKSDPSELDRMWRNMVNFGLSTTPDALGTRADGSVNSISDTDPITTVGTSRLESNKAIISEHTRITGLIGIFESIAFTDFQTTSQLEQAIQILNQKYNDYFENNNYPKSDNPALNTKEYAIPSLANDPNVRTQMLELKTNVNTIVESQLANIWRITEISKMKTSMMLTSYKYYESVDNASIISSLNPNTNISNFNEPIKIVER